MPTSSPASLVAELARARAHTLPDDVIEATKRAVIAEVESLDPAAEVRSTEYFNHSFAPDLVVGWGAKKNGTERPIYLRGSIETALLAKDLRTHASSKPVILSLGPESASHVFARSEEARRDALRQEKHSKGSLLTDATALDSLTSAPSGIDAPLNELVRRSFVRGGRGVVDDTQARRLLPELSTLVEADGAVRYTEALREAFDSRSAARIGTVATIINLAASGEAVDSKLEHLSSEEQLSASELQALAPWLLTQSSVNVSGSFWRWLATQFDFRDLEEQSEAFADVDLDPLIGAASEIWLARRVSLYFADENDSSTGWRIRNGILSYRVGEHMLYLASDQRRIRKLSGREGRSQARWSDISRVLEDFELRGVELQGLTRRHSVSAEVARDVRQDVDLIVDTIDDSFHVPSVTIADAADSDLLIELDFGAMIGSAPRGASIRSLATSGVTVLGYRSSLAAPFGD